MNQPPEDFAIFKSFQSSELARDMMDSLTEGGIAYHIEENSFSVDITFVGGSPTNLQLYIHKDKFVDANLLLEKNARETIDKLPEDYYLYSFSEEELQEIIEVPEQWSTLDFVLATELLKEKGHDLNIDKIQELKQSRINELATGKRAETAYIVFGYLLGVGGSLWGALILNQWYLGLGLLGILMGYILWRHKVTLPNGEKVFAYDQRSQKQGKQIFWVGTIFFALFVSFSIWVVITDSAERFRYF